MSVDYPGIDSEAWRHHPAIVDTFYGGALPEVPPVKSPYKPFDPEKFSLAGIETSPLIAEMQRKIQEETERVLALAPPAPEGFRWVMQLVVPDFREGIDDNSYILRIKPTLVPV